MGRHRHVVGSSASVKPRPRLWGRTWYSSASLWGAPTRAPMPGQSGSDCLRPGPVVALSTLRRPKLANVTLQSFVLPRTIFQVSLLIVSSAHHHKAALRSQTLNSRTIRRQHLLMTRIALEMIPCQSHSLSLITNTV